MERQNVHNSRDGKINFQFEGPENKCRGHEFVGGEGGGVGKEELGDVFWGLLRLKAHLFTFK